MNDKKNVFPIGMWNYHALGNDVQKPSEAKRWADCGLNTPISPVFSYERNTVEEMLALLDACEEVGVRLIIEVDALNYTKAEDEAKYRETFERAYKDFGHHPATYGFFVADEPGNEHLSTLCKRAYRIQREIAPELHPYVNFLPVMEEYFPDFGSFGEWLDSYVDDVRPEMIGYDHYGQMVKTDGGINGHFYNLREYMDVCHKYGCDLWVTLLCCACFRSKAPTEEDFYWQISTSVACGAKGIMWYGYYGGLMMGNQNYRDCPIDENFEKSPTYTAMTRAHKRFKAMHAELFMNLTHEKTYMIEKSYGGFPLFTTEDHPILLKVKGENPFTPHLSGTLSFFRDSEGKQYVVLVNNSMERSGCFTFVLDRKHLHNFKRLCINGTERNTIFHQSEEDIANAPEGSVFTHPRFLADGQMEVFEID